MRKAYLVLMILLLGSRVDFAQNKIPLNPFGLEMDEPIRWFPIDKEMISESLRRLELKKESLEELLDQNEGRQLLFAYVKYKQDSFNGINPKIEARVIRIRSQRALNFSEFEPLAKSTLRKIASGFDEQSYVVEPSQIKIGSIDAVYHISEFSLRANKGGNHRVRSRTYLIPRGTYFFQISYVDEPKKDDLSAEFDKLVSSINLRN